MTDHNAQLLRLCGFEADELDLVLPRAAETFTRLDLGQDDIRVAIDWVSQNHDVELRGARKLLRVWLNELFNLVLAREDNKQIVYYGFPTLGGLGMAIAQASKQVLCASPEVILCHTLGQIFNKLSPVLEAGEENGLPPGHSLCTLQTIRVGALSKGIIPVPDIVLNSSFYCDMGAKTGGLLEYRYGLPNIIIDGSMDSDWGEFPAYSPERIAFLGGQLNKGIKQLEDILGITVTPEAWNSGISASRTLFGTVGELTRLINVDPQPISVVSLGLARFLATGCASGGLEEANEAAKILVQEVNDRVAQGIGVVPKGSPRVMMFATHFSDPSVTHMIENAGLAIPVMFMNAPLRMEPFETTYETMGEKQAELEMKVGLFHSTYALLKRWAEVTEDTDVDGGIWGYQFNCRPGALPSHLLKKWAEAETGVPILLLEMDFYDSRQYSAHNLQSRVETFADMLREKQRL